VTSDGGDAAAVTGPALVDDLSPTWSTGAMARLPRRGIVAVTGYDPAAEVWSDATAFSS
jgi:hypothetical protein